MDTGAAERNMMFLVGTYAVIMQTTEWEKEGLGAMVCILTEKMGKDEFGNDVYKAKVTMSNLEPREIEISTAEMNFITIEKLIHKCNTHCYCYRRNERKISD